MDYVLPEELIAQQPARGRSESRLLVLERRTGRITDSRFAKIGEYLREGDCLVLNDTKVLAARFFARRTTGGKLEGLFLEQPDKGVWEVMLKGLGKVKAGERIRLKDIRGEDFCCAEVVEKKDDGKCVLRVEAEGPAEKSAGKDWFCAGAAVYQAGRGFTAGGERQGAIPDGLCPSVWVRLRRRRRVCILRRSLSGSLRSGV